MARMFGGGRSPHTLGGKLMRMNWILLLAIAILAGIGTGVLTSVNGGSFQPWAERHALRFLVGAGLVIVMALVPPRIWLRLAYPAYGIGVVLLALVPVMGVEALGAKRWLAVAGTTFQPSEIVKIALVAALARFYQTLKPDRVSSPGWVLVPLLMIFVPVVLTLRQPDLGTAVLFAATGLVMMFLAGVHAGYFAVGAVAAVAAVPLVLSRLQGYQRKRLEVFLDPDKDPLGAGYHITQAKIALGSGGISGKGFMRGTQTQLDFVPEKHTDFIFAILGEEWGFVGTVTVLGLFALVVVLALISAFRARNQFARLLLAGFAVTIFVYAFINMAMVTGIAPVVGVPLPLISYGGTNMITLMVALGIAMSAHVHGQQPLRFE